MTSRAALRAAILVISLTAAPALAAPSVEVTATAGASALTLDGEGVSSTHIVKVADVSMSTLGLNGFTAAITSGNLTNGDQATPIPFQVALADDGAAPPPSSAFTVASGDTLLFSTSGPGSAEKDLYIQYSPADLQDPGVYAASISLSLTDN